ncbi:MAG: apolipoprotein N-acyltransferase [Acidimicrobiia bacterium]
MNVVLRTAPHETGESVPAPAGGPRRAASRKARLAAAAAAGLVLAACFPPLDLGPLALGALVPLLWAWQDAGGARWGALYGMVAGTAFFGVLVSWTWFFGPVAYLPFVLVLSLWWALAGAVVGWLDARNLASVPAVAAVWVLIEAGRGRWPFGGFSWGEVGYAFHDIPAGRALASWGGVLGVSFGAVLVNGLLLGAARAARRGRCRLPRYGLGLGLVVAAVVFANVAQPALTATGVLRAALVQGNDKNRDPTPAERADRYLTRNHLRLAGEIDEDVDLVVLPESSLDADPRSDDFLDSELTGIARRLDASVLAGGDTRAPEGRLYNTTFQYGPQGRTPALYRKRHLVPFGEFVPFREALSFVEALEQIPRDYAPGKRPRIFAVGETPVGTLICFESAFAGLARGYARNGAEALLVSTNNRSFRRSANAAQHLAIGQMRAAEVGRPVLQAAISGISGFIDAGGDLLSQTSLFEDTVLVGEVTTTSGRTVYANWGDWVLGVAALVLATATARRLRSHATQREPKRQR